MKRRSFIKTASVLGVTSMLPYSLRAFAASATPTLPIPGLLKADAAGKIRIKIQKGQTQWTKQPTNTWGYNGALLGPALWLQRGQKVSLEIENALDEDTAVHWHGLEIPGLVDGGPQSPVLPGKIWTPEFTIDQPAATCWFHPHPHAKTGRHVAMGLSGLLLINDEESQRLPLPKNWGLDDIPVVLQDKRLNADGQIDYKVDVVSAAVGWFGELMLTNGALYPQHTAPRGWLRLRLLNGCNARSLRLAASDQRLLYVIAGDGGFLPEPVKLTELPILMGERFEVLVDLRDGKPFDLVTLPVRQMGMGMPPFDAPLPVLRINPSLDKGQTLLPDKLVSLPGLPSLEGVPTRMLKLSMDGRLDHEGMSELMKRYGDKAMSGMKMEGMMDGMKMGGQGSMTGGQGSMMGHGGMMGGMMGQGGQGSMASQGGQGGMTGGMGMGGQGSMMGGMNMPGQASGPLDLWHANFINGQAFVMNTPAFDVKKDVYERWIISGEGDMMLHPFHIHGTQFRILSENGAPVAQHRQGFKDTVRVEGKNSEVLVRFKHAAPQEHMFMAHCHLLEHEDTGMMLAFMVS